MLKVSKRNSIGRSGSSLVDVGGCCVLTAMLLVPSMAVMRDSIGLHKTLHVRQLLLANPKVCWKKNYGNLSGGKAPRSYSAQNKVNDSVIAFQVTGLLTAKHSVVSRAI